ncbi:MAG: apolipoprotein N-acyltransferase [Alphaproteobacteria bacterium]|nr:apolipoprotein N-acyltransferase [Alphaproteobacteria bacterium]
MRHPNIAALAAGLLSATGFAPLGLWPVTILCFALLIALVGNAPNLRGALARGWWFGVGQFTVGLNWIAHAFTFQDAMPHWFGYGAVVLVSLYLAIYPAMATGLAWKYGRQDRRQLVLLFAVAWIVTEWLRANMFTGFAWNPLGVIWIATLPLADSARWVGTYGLSGLAVLVAGTLFLGITSDHKRFAALSALILAIVMSAAHFVHPAAPPPRTNVPIRIIQPNIGQEDKHVAAQEENNFRKLAQLSGLPSVKPRLLFWPEAAIPAILDMEPEWRDRVAGLLGPRDLLMTGGLKLYYKFEDKGFYQANTLTAANNSLWVLTPDSRLVGRYDKAHLVPFGEYLPMRSILKPLGLSRLVPGDVDFWPGPGPQTLPLPAAGERPALKMGVQICYEIIFSGQVVNEENRPDFLFNPSNDAWFGSWGPPQHLAQTRLRALEEGLPIVRSTPTGISAVVAANGALLDSLPHQQVGYIDAFLPGKLPPTPFSQLGNLASFLFVLLIFCGSIAMRRWSR